MTGAPDALEVAESVPQAAAEQPVPERDQVTPPFWESNCTVAVKDCVRRARAAAACSQEQAKREGNGATGFGEMAVTFGWMQGNPPGLILSLQEHAWKLSAGGIGFRFGKRYHEK